MTIMGNYGKPPKRDAFGNIIPDYSDMGAILGPISPDAPMIGGRETLGLLNPQPSIGGLLGYGGAAPASQLPPEPVSSPGAGPPLAHESRAPRAVIGGEMLDPMSGVRNALVDNAMTTAAPKKKGGFDGFLKELGHVLPGMLMALGGNQYGATQYAMAHRKRHDDERAEEKKRATLAQLDQSLIRLGYTNPDERAWMMADPEKTAGEMAKRYGTFALDQTDTLVSGGPGGAPKSVYRPSQTFDQGPDRFEYSPMSGQTSRIHAGRAEAEVYADSLGLVRGTKQWGDAVRDYVLKGNGPTAFGQDQQLQGERLSQQDRENRRTTATSQYNTLMNEAGEFRRQATDLRAGKYQGKGGRAARSGGVAEGTVIRNPSTGEKMIRRGGKWVAHR